MRQFAAIVFLCLLFVAVPDACALFLGVPPIGSMRVVAREGQTDGISIQSYASYAEGRVTTQTVITNRSHSVITVDVSIYQIRTSAGIVKIQGIVQSRTVHAGNSESITDYYEDSGRRILAVQIKSLIRGERSSRLQWINVR